MHPPDDVRSSRPESNRLQVPRGKKDSPQTESTYWTAARGMEQRDFERKGSAFGMQVPINLAVLKIHQVKGAAGRSVAVVDAVHRQLDLPLEQAERRPREKAAEKTSLSYRWEQ